jgi:hypothetical protein
MKVLQIIFTCLILLVGQVALSYAAPDVEGEIVPRPEGGNTNWGHSVDISGTTLIAGYTSYVGNAGGVFIMEQQGKRWNILDHFKTPDNGTRDQYGHSVAIEDDIAVVSAYEHGGKKPVAGGPLGEGPGRVYIYQRHGKGFGEIAKLKGEGIKNNDRFGYSVDISGKTLVAGTPFHDEQKGAVYVYTLDNKQWKQQAKLQADDASVKNRFGWDCAVSENTIVVGAPLAAAPARLSGAAYVFKRQGDAWAQVAKITPDDGDGGDSFGAAVDVSKSRIIVGANKDENEAKKRGSGSAYIFSGVGNVYTQDAKLTADEPQEAAVFGFSVALDVNRALVGAPATDTKADENSGAVYAFLKVGADWVLQARVIPGKGPDEVGLAFGDNMGSAVALDGQFGRNFNFAAIGVQWDAQEGGGDAGSVYIFDTEDEDSLNIPLSVEPRGDLALTTFGDIKRTALLQNFPNPFNPETWFPYRLAVDGPVTLRVYDIKGQLIRRLPLGEKRAGSYLTRERAAYWDGSNETGESVSTGVYFYRLDAGTFSDVRRMILAK